jgi:hypothetical protein
MLHNRKRLPEIIKRIPSARITPLEEINWRKEYYIMNFFKELRKSSRVKISKSRLKSLYLYNADLRSIFVDMALIVSRINVDGSCINRMEELYDFANYRKWTDSEAEEIEELQPAVDFFNLDVKSLLIFILIFMDKLAGFLSLLIDKKEKKLRAGSFFHFKKDLMKLRGVQDIKQIITENTKWFKEVKDLRDDFVEHHPGAGGAVTFKNGKAYATITTRKNVDRELKYIVMDSQAKDISIEELDEILSQLKKLLKTLDEHLRSQISILPFKVE